MHSRQATYQLKYVLIPSALTYVSSVLVMLVAIVLADRLHAIELEWSLTQSALNSSGLCYIVWAGSAEGMTHYTWLFLETRFPFVGLLKACSPGWHFWEMVDSLGLMGNP